jgi:hypothetical protein
VEEFHNPLGPRDQDKVSSATVGDGGSELDGVVLMPFGNLSKFIIVEDTKGLNSAPLPMVGPVVTPPSQQQKPLNNLKI